MIKYGVKNIHSKRVVKAEEKELKNMDFDYIFSSEMTAYRFIFVRLNEKELLSRLGKTIERKIYKDSFKNNSHKEGDFIKERLDKLSLQNV